MCVYARECMCMYAHVSEDAQKSSEGGVMRLELHVAISCPTQVLSSCPSQEYHSQNPILKTFNSHREI